MYVYLCYILIFIILLLIVFYKATKHNLNRNNVTWNSLRRSTAAAAMRRYFYVFQTQKKCGYQRVVGKTKNYVSTSFAKSSAMFLTGFYLVDLRDADVSLIREGRRLADCISIKNRRI